MNASLIRFLAAAAGAATFAGCVAVGPDYHLPAGAVLNAPAARQPFVNAGGQATAAEAAMPSRWWLLYQDPQLDRLIMAALAANDNLKIAEANLERSHAAVQVAKAARQPQGGFNLEGGPTVLSGESYLLNEALPESDLYDVGIGVSYRLDFFGRTQRAVEAAEADHGAVEAARDWVRISVVAAVAESYVDLCLAGEESTTTVALLGVQEKGLQLTRRLLTEGRAGRLDVRRLEGQIEAFRANLPAFEAARRNALYRLATLTGQTPAEFPAEWEQSVRLPQLGAPIPVGDGAAMLKRRPDIRAAERRLAAATAEIGVVTAGLYPDIRLGASLGSTGNVGDFLTAPTNFYSVGPSIRWELNQSATRARIHGAKASQQAALAAFDGTVLTALREVETALNNYSHDLARQKHLMAARDIAAQVLADARQLQRAGRTGALTALDAERSLVSAELTVTALRGQIARDQLALFLALGGGWEQ